MIADTVTRNELIKTVLKRLGQWQAGQDMAPEDYEAIDEELNGHLAAMGVADIYTVEDADAVPIEVYLEVANYLANEYAEVFGLQGEELATVQAKSALAEKALRYVRTRKPTFQPMQPDYF